VWNSSRSEQCSIARAGARLSTRRSCHMLAGGITLRQAHVCDVGLVKVAVCNGLELGDPAAMLSYLVYAVLRKSRHLRMTYCDAGSCCGAGSYCDIESAYVMPYAASSRMLTPASACLVPERSGSAMGWLSCTSCAVANNSADSFCDVSPSDRSYNIPYYAE
jgi:hypothetical protein